MWLWVIDACPAHSTTIKRCVDLSDNLPGSKWHHPPPRRSAASCEPRHLPVVPFQSPVPSFLEVVGPGSRPVRGYLRCEFH